MKVVYLSSKEMIYTLYCSSDNSSETVRFRLQKRENTLACAGRVN